MANRIRIVKSPTLTVNGTGDGFDDFTTGTYDPNWAYDSTNDLAITPNIDGEILKVVLNFTSSDSDAVITIATRDTPVENVINKTDWSSDVTIYPLVEGLLNTGGTAAADKKENVFCKYAVKGSLNIGCSSATDNDSLVVKIYYR